MLPFYFLQQNTFLLFYQYFCIEMMLRFSIVFICLFNSAILFGQSFKSQDSLVNQLIERQKAINAQKMTMSGYRIQLFFGGDRARANNMRLDFLQQYPDLGAYVIYQQPNFKLRIGDFKSRMEAATFLKEMQPGYSMAFIVPDEVKLPVIE